MSVNYRDVQKSKTNDGFSQVLREASEYFASQKIQMVGPGFEEILSEESLFREYVSKLTEGLSPDETEQITQLLENARTNILIESSITGIQPIQSLTMPTVRKMWNRVSLKHAVPTEVVKAPKFTISYMEPYLLDADGTKHLLPKALREPNNTHAEKVALSSAQILMSDAGAITNGVAGYDLLADVQASIAIGDAVDPKFWIKTITIECADKTGAGDSEDVEVTVMIPLNTANYSLHGEVSAAHTDKTVTSDIFFGHVDLQKGLITASSLTGKIKSFTVRGWLSSENNARTQSVSFDIKNKDINIGTGAHINAPLPIEWLQDTMAMYRIDGALEVVDLMSNITATKLEYEIIEFLDDSFVKSGKPYERQFDCYPSAAYAGRPKEWREELKTIIDHAALTMKRDSAFSNGKFVLMGSPVDMQLIPNVNWTFSHVTEQNAGVEVEYSLGAFSGANRYEVVSSDHWPDGTIRMIYVPNVNNQMTYKYFPYTFNVEKGYRDPNREYVPSIMMTKRHTIEELTPLACVITILHNDGTLPPSA